MPIVGVSIAVARRMTFTTRHLPDRRRSLAAPAGQPTGRATQPPMQWNPMSSADMTFFDLPST
jgi:hypothetical protein